MVVQLDLSELSAHLPDRFIMEFCSSFEERTLTSLQNIRSNQLARVFAFKNIDSDIDRSEIDREVEVILKNVPRTKFDLKKDYPTFTADQIYTALFLASKQKEPFVVDISTFTHEALL